ncbi:hypothetical protein ACJX0J_039426, partial [Zea mays]
FELFHINGNFIDKTLIVANILLSHIFDTYKYNGLGIIEKGVLETSFFSRDFYFYKVTYFLYIQVTDKAYLDNLLL